jgi:hypothetical protein
MITIYLDWNVIVQMKNGFHKDLREILKQERFLIPYSTSHIGDIFASFKEDDQEQEKLINGDLEYLYGLCKNNCLSNDGKEVRLQHYHPKDLFEQKVNERDLFTDFSIDKLSEMLQGEKNIEGAANLLASIKDMPLDRYFIDALNNPEAEKHLDTIFPGLKENPTMGGFFKCFGNMLTRMNEGEGYKELRKLTQTGLGIKRDQIFDADDPYSMIKEVYEKLNIPANIINQANSKYAPAWFDEISNEYLKLDMHGYQEDKVKTNKGRKETFRNTTEDSFHAAFASTCNFYICNDNKAYSKTVKVFEKLSLNTLIFKPEEFLDYYNTFLSIRPIASEIEIPIAYLDTDSFTEDDAEDGFVRTYHVPHFVFDFFNKMIATFDKSGKVTMLVLSKFNPTNKNTTYYFELEPLSRKLISALGEDSQKLGTINQKEFQEKEWGGRLWRVGAHSFKLICLNGNVQFYYNLNSEE